MTFRFPNLLAPCLLLLIGSALAELSPLERIPVATFEKMKEVERYQIRIAEKHYTDGDFKTALAEFEKFLTLYEKSPGAPYAQLMWSHSMMHLKSPKPRCVMASNLSSTTGRIQKKPQSPLTASPMHTARWARSMTRKKPSDF